MAVEILRENPNKYTKKQVRLALASHRAKIKHGELEPNFDTFIEDLGDLK